MNEHPLFEVRQKPVALTTDSKNSDPERKARGLYEKNGRVPPGAAISLIEVKLDQSPGFLGAWDAVLLTLRSATLLSIWSTVASTVATRLASGG